MLDQKFIEVCDLICLNLASRKICAAEELDISVFVLNLYNIWLETCFEGLLLSIKLNSTGKISRQ